jgi:hypothetical protein
VDSKGEALPDAIEKKLKIVQDGEKSGVTKTTTKRKSVSSELLAAQQRASSPTKQWLSPYSHAREWNATTVAYVELVNTNV